MMKIILFNFMFLTMLSGVLWAQDRTVTGTVTAAEDGTPLPGVNVVVQGSTIGTTTDIEGEYSVSVPEGSNTLVFSFIGYATQEIAVGDRSVIDVELGSDIRQLGEVVVTALGIERERASLGYSVQEVSGAEISTVRQTNVVNSLAGRVAGVQITSGGAQGGSSRILIRGANSIAGNNQPLFVVDGTPIDNTPRYANTVRDRNQQRGAGGYDYGNLAQDINPDDIESITVLKGANAAALYGNRASNGVIMITTKRGTRDTGVGIAVNSGVTFEDILVMPKWQNEFGGGYDEVSEFNAQGQRVFYYGADESWGPRLDGRPMRQWYSYYEDDPDFGRETPWVASPNNIRDFFETGLTFTNNIALSGGTETGDFRLSYTNLDQKFIAPNGNMQRHTLNFTGRQQFTDRFSATISANYINNQAQGRLGTGYGFGENPMSSFSQWFQRQVGMDRLRNYRTPEGGQRTWNIRSPSNLNPNYWDNPFWTRYENFQNDQRDRLFGNIALTYEFSDNLSLTARAMNDSYTDRREERIAEGSLELSEYREEVRTFAERNFDAILNYNQEISDFSISANLGLNHRNETYHENSGVTQGGLSVAGFYSLENSIDRPELRDVLTERVINSVFGSASIGFRNFLYVDLTARNDWSSTLPLENNSFFYPSVTTSFVFSELMNNNVISLGKLRAGWAKVGNDTDPYRLYPVYSPVVNFGSDPIFTLPNTRNNPDLLPEETYSWEVGAEMSFLQNRLGFDVTYYNARSINQIFDVPASSATGYSRLIINAGEMRNRGVELMLFGSPVQTAGGFNWDVNVNWARNRNEVVSLTEGINTLRFAELFGGAVEARVGQPYGAIIGKGFVYDESGNKVVQANGNYARTVEDQYLGSFIADWTGGIRNSFSFRGFNLNVLIDGQMGGSLYSVTNMFGKYSGLTEETVEGGIRERGMIFEGVNESGEENTVVVSPVSAFASLFGLHEAYVYDATYAKLREVSFGYTIPNRVFGRLPFRGVSINLIGRNLAILYKKVPHIDPETTTNAGNIQGIEGAAVPTTRSIGFNLRFNL